jgi:two-component sensor histidine kinase
VFEGRLLALARANRELVELNWAGVSLSQILKLNLAPFAGRSTIDGVDTRLSPKDGQHFSLAVHELVTNAAKYGALSNQSGKVRVAWNIRRDGDKRQLHFTWQEIGGPSVVTPHREGFGTVLLRTVFPDARLDFQPRGLTCEISLLLGEEGGLSFSVAQKLQE